MTTGCADKVKITGLLIKNTALAVTPCDPSIFPNCARDSETHNNFPYPTKTPRLSQENLNQNGKPAAMTYKANIKFVKIQRKFYKPSPRDKPANVHSNPEIRQASKTTMDTVMALFFSRDGSPRFKSIEHFASKTGLKPKLNFKKMH